jgi:hypothetical protein
MSAYFRKKIKCYSQEDAKTEDFKVVCLFVVKQVCVPQKYRLDNLPLPVL